MSISTGNKDSNVFWIHVHSPTASTLGRAASADTVGCSLDWPDRNRDAEGVKTTRIESWFEEYLDSAWMMLGSLMVATLPLYPELNKPFKPTDYSTRI